MQLWAKCFAYLYILLEKMQADGQLKLTIALAFLLCYNNYNKFIGSKL